MPVSKVFIKHSIAEQNALNIYRPQAITLIIPAMKNSKKYYNINNIGFSIKTINR